MRASAEPVAGCGSVSSEPAVEGGADVSTLTCVTLPLSPGLPIRTLTFTFAETPAGAGAGLSAVGVVAADGGASVSGAGAPATGSGAGVSVVVSRSAGVISGCELASCAGAELSASADGSTSGASASGDGGLAWQSIPDSVTAVFSLALDPRERFLAAGRVNRIAVYDLISKRDELTKHKQYAKLEASIVAPNRIEVTTKRVQRFSLFLNEHLIDSTKPVTVVANGEVVFQGLVTPKVEILLRQARLRQDPRQLFPILVMISIPKHAS